MHNNRKLDRAKLFLSFDALKGFREIIKTKERIVIPIKELSPDDLYELNWKIHQIKVGEMIKIVYYNQNEYIELEGMVADIDLENKHFIQIVDKIIMIKDIVHIEIDSISYI